MTKSWIICFVSVELMPVILFQDVYATMECFESLFTRSYVREDGSRPCLSPQTTQLHTNALLSWALLLTICSASQITAIIHKYEALV